MSTLSKELWKPARFKDYTNNNFLISNLGRVCNVRNNHISIQSKKKYRRQIHLFKNGNRKNVQLAWIVYYLFNGGYTKDKTEVIDHINNICWDNRICNLQKISFSENVAKDHWTKKTKDLPCNIMKVENNSYKALYKIKGNKRFNDKNVYLGQYFSVEQAKEAINIANHSDKLYKSNNIDKKALAINSCIDEYRATQDLVPIKRHCLNSAVVGKINYLYKYSYYGSMLMQKRHNKKSFKKT